MGRSQAPVPGTPASGTPCVTPTPTATIDVDVTARSNLAGFRGGGGIASAVSSTVCPTDGAVPIGVRSGTIDLASSPVADRTPDPRHAAGRRRLRLPPTSRKGAT